MGVFRNIGHAVYGFFVSPVLVDVGFGRFIADDQANGQITVVLKTKVYDQRTGQHHTKSKFERVSFVAHQKTRIAKPTRTIVKGIIKQAHALGLTPKTVMVKTKDGQRIYNEAGDLVH